MSMTENGRPKGHSRRLSSFSSKHSGEHKLDLVESPKDKERTRMTTKADPNKAILEVQPSEETYAVANTLPTLDIRKLQHKDVNGDMITDPDRSNPTRPRMESPLATIRAFEAAVDGTYGKRQSYRAPNNYNASRRSSYFGMPTQQGMTPPRSDRQARGQSYRESYHESSPRRLGPGHRNVSDPMLYGRGDNNTGYSHGYNNSQSYTDHGYDSNVSGSASGTDRWTQSTNPSSEDSYGAGYNSSQGQYKNGYDAHEYGNVHHTIDENQQYNGVQGSDEYGNYGSQPQQYPQQQGYDSYNNAPPPPPQSQSQSQYPARTTSQSQSQGQGLRNQDIAPPPPPQHSYSNGPQARGPTSSPSKRLSRNQSSNYGTQASSPARSPGSMPMSSPSRPANEKRKSWLSRTFSRS